MDKKRDSKRVFVRSSFSGDVISIHLGRGYFYFSVPVFKLAVFFELKKLTKFIFFIAWQHIEVVFHE